MAKNGFRPSWAAKTRRRRKGRGKRYGQGKPLVGAQGRLTTGKYSPGITTIPDRQPVTFKYSQVFNLTTGSAPTALIWGGNVVNDPDISSGSSGLLPSGYHEWLSLYQKLTCSSSKIVVRMFNPNAMTALVCVFPSNDPSVATAMEDVLSKARSKHQMIGNYKENLPIVCSCTSAAIKGVRNTLYGDEIEMAFAPAAGPPMLNPKEPWYWNVVAQAHDRATSIELQMEVTIYYNCMMYDRLNIIPKPISVLGTLPGTV